MGALARVRIHYVDLPEWLKEFTIHNSQFRIYGTLLDGENMYATDLRPEGLIIMGNEGNGISEEVRKLVTHPIRIPNYPNKEASDVVESLNVSIATAIVLAEFRRSSGSTPA